MKATTSKSRFACALLLVAAASASAQAPRVPVNEFVVTGNTLLPPDVLDAALSRFKGERSLDELKQAAQAVQALYREAGYGAVVAYVPEQSGAPGRATIAVLEGRIARIAVTGNSRFSEDNIRRSLPLLTLGVTPAVRRLDAQIQLANENPAKQLALSLEAGQGPGEVEARIVVTELPPSRWSVSLDNSGNANTGRTRATLGYQNAALWDLDHVASLQLQVSPEKIESVAVLSASYRIPLYVPGMTVDLFAAHSDVDGGSTSTLAGPLQFSGKGEVLGLRLNKPLGRWGELDQRLSLGLDWRAYLNECGIVGLPAGACGSSGASVAVHPISLEYSVQRAGERPLGFNLSLSHNLALGGRHAAASDFDAVRAGAKRRYSMLRAGAYGALALPAAWRLQARINGQSSGDALVPGEQFGIAGANTVRGYEEREVTGDSGVVASVELYSPDMLRTAENQRMTLRWLGFADGGKAWNHLDTPCRDSQSSCSLRSLGLGLRLGLGAWQLRLDLAHALTKGTRTARGDNRAHLQATYSFQ